jgi:hypothetical protein
MKARQVFAKNSVDGRRSLEPSEHLFVITDDGRLFERFSDDEPGHWSEVPLPKGNGRKRLERQKR